MDNQTTTTGNPVRLIPTVMPPLSPRLYILVVALRRALLILAEALGEIAGLDPRPKKV